MAYLQSIRGGGGRRGGGAENLFAACGGVHRGGLDMSAQWRKRKLSNKPLRGVKMRLAGAGGGGGGAWHKRGGVAWRGGVRRRRRRYRGVMAAK